MSAAASDDGGMRAEHTATAIHQRLTSDTNHSYLRDFVYGGIAAALAFAAGYLLRDVV